MVKANIRVTGFVLLFGAVLFVFAQHAKAQGSHPVGLELVLLVDTSASVDEGEFRLQTDGLAAAFLSQPVLSAIRSHGPRGIAVCVIQWSNHERQHKSIDWTLLSNEGDAVSLAERIASMKRAIQGGHTAIGDALIFAVKEIQSNRYQGLRRVIDVSGDGRLNDGRPLRGARKEVLSHGITINGLAIINELPLLADYYGSQLIGGDGAFVLVARDYTDIARAMSIKLEREIRSMPVTKLFEPGKASVRVAGNG
ncbi:MAG: DUF1194 domain-containing protein [Hyphomicrobiales bacterium]